MGSAGGPARRPAPGRRRHRKGAATCRGLCETGSTPFLDMLGGLCPWLAAHPDEVVTPFIEDHADADLIADDVEAAGLLPFVHEPVPGQRWPTLAGMIRSGDRLVVMLDEGRGGATARGW